MKKQNLQSVDTMILDNLLIYFFVIYLNKKPPYSV